MHCITDTGKVLAHCAADCPLRLQAEAQIQFILQKLPENYRNLHAIVDMPEDLMTLLCHLQHYCGCITRDASGCYRQIRPLPEEKECPFINGDE